MRLDTGLESLQRLSWSILETSPHWRARCRGLRRLDLAVEISKILKDSMCLLHVGWDLEFEAVEICWIAIEINRLLYSDLLIPLLDRQQDEIVDEIEKHHKAARLWSWSCRGVLQEESHCGFTFWQSSWNTSNKHGWAWLSVSNVLLCS